MHKDSIAIAVLPADAKAPTRLERLPNDLPQLKKWIARVARDGEIRACYEASGAGYVLHRALREWGYACEVIALSLIPKRPGVQRKHDKRDATYVRLDICHARHMLIIIWQWRTSHSCGCVAR